MIFHSYVSLPEGISSASRWGDVLKAAVSSSGEALQYASDELHLAEISPWVWTTTWNGMGHPKSPIYHIIYRYIYIYCYCYVNYMIHIYIYYIIYIHIYIYIWLICACVLIHGLEMDHRLGDWGTSREPRRKCSFHWCSIPNYARNGQPHLDDTDRL